MGSNPTADKFDVESRRDAADAIGAARYPDVFGASWSAATKHDSLAERSKAVAQGAIPKGRGFEPHSCHFVTGHGHVCGLPSSVEAPTLSLMLV